MFWETSDNSPLIVTLFVITLAPQSLQNLAPLVIFDVQFLQNIFKRLVLVDVKIVKIVEWAQTKKRPRCRGRFKF